MNGRQFCWYLAFWKLVLCPWLESDVLVHHATLKQYQMPSKVHGKICENVRVRSCSVLVHVQPGKWNLLVQKPWTVGLATVGRLQIVQVSWSTLYLAAMQEPQDWLVTASSSGLCLLRGDIDLLSSWISEQLPALMAAQLLQQLPTQVSSGQH